MASSKTQTGQELPPSLRNFLTVTEADGAPRTGLVEPSPLLSRIQAFLPQMAAANDALDSAASEESAVQVEKVVGEEKETDKDADADTVKMDLYVNESFGELVGGATFEAEDDSDGDYNESTEQPDTGTGRPLIEVVPKEDGNRQAVEDLTENPNSRIDAN